MFGFGNKQATLACKGLPELFVVVSEGVCKAFCGVMGGELKMSDYPQLIMAVKYVPNGTKIEVIQLQVDKALAHIKILEGEHKNYEGWVPSFFVK